MLEKKIELANQEHQKVKDESEKQRREEQRIKEEEEKKKLKNVN